MDSIAHPRRWDEGRRAYGSTKRSTYFWARPKGPREVEAVPARVCAKLRRRIGPKERLLVIRTVGPQPEWAYSLSNASPDEPLAELVRVRSSRHRIEEVFQQAKGEAGLAHYEVRSWVGWHHHVTRAVGPVVPGPGAAATRGGKPRR